MEENIFLTFWFPVFSFIISLGVAISFWLSDWYKTNQHQKYLKTTVNNNIQQLIKILESIYVQAEKIEDDDQKAKNLSYYFLRQVNRIELIRINVENYLVQISKNTQYKIEIRKILDIENWLLETYDRPDVSNEEKFFIWKEDVGILRINTKKAVELATELKIIEPITVG